MGVTESQLASALEGFYVTVDALPGKIHAQVSDADETAAALYATLSRMAALREPDGDAADVRTGDAAADPELAAMAAIVAVMDRLDEETCLLGTDVHERVIRWAMARWNIRD